MKQLLFISDSNTNSNNYTLTFNNIQKYLNHTYKNIRTNRQCLFNSEVNLKTLHDQIINKEDINLEQLSISNRCCEILLLRIEQNLVDDIRLIFLDQYGLDIFIDFLIKNGYEPYDENSSNTQKETISHLHDYTYYSLHGKIFKLKKGNTTIKLGRTLPLYYFSVESFKIMPCFSILLNDILHLTFDDNAQIIEKPCPTWYWESHYIDTIDKFNDFYSKLTKSKIICIDTETSNLNKFNNKILTIHFSLTGDESYNIPFLHKETPFCSDELEYIRMKLAQYFESGTSDYLIFHNAKFDLSVFKGTFGVKYFNHKIYDTMAGCYAIDENRMSIINVFPKLSYSLGNLSEEYGCLAYREGDLSKEDRANMDDKSLVSIMQYASKDVVIPYKIHEFQIKEAEFLKLDNFKCFVINILGEMIKTFVDIEINGLYLDKSYTESLLQPDGILKTLQKDLLNKFKDSENCKKTNILIHINEDIRNNLKNLQKVLKKALRTKSLKCIISNKLINISEELINNIDVLLKPNSVLTTDFLLFKNINKCFNDENINLIFNDYRTLITTDLTNKDSSKNNEIINELLSYSDKFSSNYYLNLFKKLKENENSIEWLFDINKPETQQLLYFFVLNLAPLADKGKSGRYGVDKDFQKHYSNVAEVNYLTEISKLNSSIKQNIEDVLDLLTNNKLKEMQEKIMKKVSLNKKLTEKDLDILSKNIEGDEKIRVNRVNSIYSFFNVVTGRSSSSSPNFQNIPTRGPFAQLVKRQYITQKGYLFIHSDLNAAEIRVAANLSGDYNLKSKFDLGMKVRLQLLFENDENKIEYLIKKLNDEGDIHRMHYRMFYDLSNDAPVSKEQRQSVKGIAFGILYGKSPQTFAKDINEKPEVGVMLYNKFFKSYPILTNYLNNLVKCAEHKLYVRSPFYRYRRLTGSLGLDKKVKNQAISTQSKNSPVQGFSSDCVYIGHRLFINLLHKLNTSYGWNIDCKICNTVHDSLEGECKIEHLPICFYLQSIVYSEFVRKFAKKYFKFEMILPQELEMDIGTCMADPENIIWRDLPNQIQKHLIGHSCFYNKEEHTKKIEETLQDNLKQYPNFNPDTIKLITEKSLEPINHKYTKEEIDEIMKKVNNNYKVINEIWKKESEVLLKEQKITSFLFDKNQIIEIGKKLMF